MKVFKPVVFFSKNLLLKKAIGQNILIKREGFTLYYFFPFEDVEYKREYKFSLIQDMLKPTKSEVRLAWAQ